ncbi:MULTISPECIES: hypothetical protein [unclassified Pseudoalteromonas]|uniref:hypothetical protein n=1 Tax=unclassified Pseudoalteromonas TaxID=194690 RepID=UPI000C06D4C4|nr:MULTISPECIES: hypothetical protein [unclassified Pseudoalteromonas]MDP2634724.1 hypothetical protein [Pseudoalteromonas sp. 1_MG-2023]PHN91326.1 hypothetical protein CSC79_03460 [Pseudoalteromonas sp. 3D05]
MSRRYLSAQEAEAALRRGRAVEVFLGGYKYSSVNTIRWVSFSNSSGCVVGNLWEALDQGSKDYADIYSFDSPAGDYNEPVKVVESPDLTAAMKELGITNQQFINSGVVQDEYIDYLESRT